MSGSVRAVAVAVAMLVATTASAEPVGVQLAGDGVPAWQAEAVARAIAARIDDDRFKGVAIRGSLAPGRVRWTIAVGGAIVKHGETELHGTDVRHLAATLTSEIGRVLQPGERQVAELPARVGGVDRGALAALAAVAVFLLIPFGRARARRGRAFRRTIVVVVGLAAGAAALVAGRGYEWSWAVFVGGGLAWGGFAAVLLPVMFPALPGLDRVEHTELVRVLARWALLSLQRIAEVAVFYAPFMAALAGACVALDLPRGVALAVLVPAWGLCVRLWVQAWVEAIAARLDGELVDGDATPANPWHDAVRGYFLGYVRRTGWEADDRLIDGIVFLPGTRDEIATYGGGTTHARIVIPRAMLEAALAPYGRPHDYAAPRVSTLHWTLWNAGLVVPTELGAISATREQRQPRSLAVEGDVDVGVLGEPVTLAGVVEPVNLDPRPSYRPHEDPLWLDYDAGEEFDGTDAGDKDFLFGLLVHELGRIRRHEDRTATLLRALRDRVARRPRLAGALRRVEHALGRQLSAIGDAHVELNYARHHFVQYLAWQLWRREDLVTARAYGPELERQSRVLARHAGGTPAGAQRRQSIDPTGEAGGPASDPAVAVPPPDAGEWGVDTAGAPDLRARIVKLAQATVRSPRARRWRRFALAGVALAAAGGVALAVVRALDYHATYQARIQPTENTNGEGN